MNETRARVGSEDWFWLVRKGRAVCPRCGRKGLGYADHPHAFGWKDHERLDCRYCRRQFKTPKKPKPE